MSIKKQVLFVRDDGKESRRYDGAGSFSEGFAAVSIIEDGRQGWGFIGGDLNEICPTKYDEVGNFNNGMAWVRSNGSYGFINSEGKEICPIVYYNVWDFSANGIALVQLKGKRGDIHYGLINRDGEEVCVAMYDYISEYNKPVVTFPIGCAMFSNWEDHSFRAYNGWWDDELAIIFLGEKKGLINSHGEVLVEPMYDDILFPQDMNARYIPVSLDGKWGYINRSGSQVTGIAYDSNTSYIPLTEKTCLSINGRYGFINKEGEEICPFKYHLVGPFSNGYAPVCIDDKWGYINEDFEEICEIKYHLAHRFESNGYAEVYTKSVLGLGHGYVNGKGEFFKKLPN